MEPRVQNINQNDPLKQWWVQAVRDPQKLGMWARRMKRRWVYSGWADEETMAESAEVNTEGIEERVLLSILWCRFDQGCEQGHGRGGVD